VTVETIARLVLRQTGSGSKIEHRALPQDDPKRRKPVIQRAIDMLGWQPRVALEKGLRATIAYFSLKVAMQQAVVGTGATPMRMRSMPSGGSSVPVR
jgi:UDP-glucuronate decarboxylase